VLFCNKHADTPHRRDSDDPPPSPLPYQRDPRPDLPLKILYDIRELALQGKTSTEEQRLKAVHDALKAAYGKRRLDEELVRIENAMKLGQYERDFGPPGIPGATDFNLSLLRVMSLARESAANGKAETEQERRKVFFDVVQQLHPIEPSNRRIYYESIFDAIDIGREQFRIKGAKGGI
jgi:hypothetical protein